MKLIIAAFISTLLTQFTFVQSAPRLRPYERGNRNRPNKPTIPSSPGFPACNVCGDSSLRVTLKDVVLTIQGQDPFTCGELEIGGDEGYIDSALCNEMPTIAEPCGCDVGNN